MYDNAFIDDAFFYYFYLEDMRNSDEFPDYHLPDHQTLQQFGDRMRQLRDERYYA